MFAAIGEKGADLPRFRCLLPLSVAIHVDLSPRLSMYWLCLRGCAVFVDLVLKEGHHFVDVRIE